MLRGIHSEKRRRASWSALVVLVAVCSLTISVATRYSAPCNISPHNVKTVQTHVSPDAARQRLAKNAANWIPPALGFAVLQAPAFYPLVASEGPSAASLFLEENLYSRPPPGI